MHHNVDHPLSLYAATKKSNEDGAQLRALYQLPVTGLASHRLRPWGRPDMALFTFTRQIFPAKRSTFTITEARQGFTYIDDIVEG